jgi:hypothetical protein
MGTARPDLDSERERRFAEALSGMSYDNPAHPTILDAEELNRWLPPHVELATMHCRQAAAQQGFRAAISEVCVGVTRTRFGSNRFIDNHMVIAVVARPAFSCRSGRLLIFTPPNR